jgi:hypothetical protein
MAGAARQHLPCDHAQLALPITLTVIQVRPLSEVYSVVGVKAHGLTLVSLLSQVAHLYHMGVLQWGKRGGVLLWSRSCRLLHLATATALYVAVTTSGAVRAFLTHLILDTVLPLPQPYTHKMVTLLLSWFPTRLASLHKGLML